MAKSRKVKSHKAEKYPKSKAKRYCFHCKKVHAASLHKQHGKGAFKRVRSAKSYKAAMKPKTKRKTKRKTRRR